MNPIIGYLGILLVVAAIIALIVDSVRRKKQSIAGDTVVQEKTPKQKKQKKQRKKNMQKNEGKDSGAQDSFAVPGVGGSRQGGRIPTGQPSCGTDAAVTVVIKRGAESDQNAGADSETRLPRRVAHLSYTGTGRFPPVIRVNLVGPQFTIGRVDINLNSQQSDFEFPASTEAVSRRHAAISCDESGFIIEDLGSRAGTMVNGMRLQPRELYRLEPGFVISFGTGGADYLWEEDL